MKPMCIKCKHCFHKGDFHDDPTGLCRYNPPVVIMNRDYGVWPKVYLNSNCSKFELEEHA